MKCGDAEWDYAVYCKEDLREEGLSTKGLAKRIYRQRIHAKAFMQSVDL